MEQKFLITDSENKIQSLLDEGWRIVSVNPQHMGAAMRGGYFAIVLERGLNQKIANNLKMEQLVVPKNDSVFK
jgi:hypothetical protein